MIQHLRQDTIAAVATPAGRGGVGIVRISGAAAKTIGETICQQSLQPRYAHFCSFSGEQGKIDEGIAIYFPGPRSFTGEDVCELQGHGGPVVMDLLMRACLRLGARPAQGGEFSERAFLNDKIDLTQAEAIADLIDANSEQAARNALRSLQGDFSETIHQFLENLINLRLYVEAAMDFPEEEIDFIGDGKIRTTLETLIDQLHSIQIRAQQGVIQREGFKLVIAGKPNAGKSSLLNLFAGRESAIVTDIAGTTRDSLKEHLQIDGIPIQVVDTAGLRDTQDPVEKIGIDRARQEIQDADQVLLLIDSTRISDTSLQTNAKTSAIQTNKTLAQINQLIDTDENLLNDWQTVEGKQIPITLVVNKTDLSGIGAGVLQDQPKVIGISTKTGAGIEQLKQQLKLLAGYQQQVEGVFTARRRHLNALEQAMTAIKNGQKLLQTQAAGELLAEDLRQAQKAINEITGEFSADDLLGKIFSSFCIGK